MAEFAFEESKQGHLFGTAWREIAMTTFRCQCLPSRLARYQSGFAQAGSGSDYGDVRWLLLFLALV
jgi:hypothetical protein